MNTKLSIQDNIFEHKTSYLSGSDASQKCTIISSDAINQLRSGDIETREIDASRANLKPIKSLAKVARIAAFILGASILAGGVVGSILITLPMLISAMGAAMILGLTLCVSSQLFGAIGEKVVQRLDELDKGSTRAIGLVAEENFSERLVGFSEENKKLFKDTVSQLELSVDKQKFLYARMIIDQKEVVNEG